MLAPFPMGLRATTNPRPAPPTMHHPRIPSPSLSNSSTDSDDSLSLLSIADLPPFSDKPSYYNYEQTAPPRPPRNPQRIKESVPFIHRRLEPAPSPYPPPSAPLPLPPSTLPLNLDLSAKRHPSPLHILTHPYTLPESQLPALNQLSLTPSLNPTPSSSSQPLPSPPSTPPSSRHRSTTLPQPHHRPKVHFTQDTLPHTLGNTQIHPHSNNANTMIPTPGAYTPWSAQPSRPTHHHLTETDGRHRPTRLSSISSSITPQTRRSSESSTHLAPRGPVGVPIRRAGPGAFVSRPASARTQALPISTSPRSLFTLMTDSDSDDAPPTRDNHNSPPSDAALVLNVHGGLDTSSRLHHRFKRVEVPYPRSYERGILDLDILDMYLTRQMSGGSLTWHVFPPSWNVPVQGALKKILDVGCGNGAWVIEAAKYWRGCQVVGLDVVSLHPNLMQVSKDKDVARRVSWVQGNFLERLPFNDDEFDFVHVKRIARGVPENKWNHLFDEILRVMKPGAAFEVVEEDLTFPGWSEHEGSEVGTLRSTRSNISASQRDSYLSIQSNRNQSGRSSAVDSTSSTSDSAIATSTKPKPDSRPSAKSDSSSKPSITIDVQPSSSTSSYDAANRPSISIFCPDDTRILTSSPTDMYRSNSLRQPPPTPKAVNPKRPATAGSSTSSISPSILSKPSTPPLSSSMSTTASKSSIAPPPTPKMGQAARDILREDTTASFFAPSSPSSLKNRTINPPKVQKRVSANTAVLQELTSPPFFMPQNRSSKPLGEDRGGGGWRGRLPFGKVLKVPMPEQVQEDEVVVVSADGLSPQGSADETRLSEGVPPQANGIPPSPPPKESRNVEVPPDPRDHSILEKIYNDMHAARFINLSPLSLLASEMESWFKNVRTHPPIVFRFPPPSRETPSPCGMRSLHIPTGGTMTENANSNSNPIISLDGLRNGASPYASLDASTQTGTQIRTRLPNPALDIDLRSLNLHLALRVKEIVACAEAMWEWVCEFQRREGQMRRDDGIYASILELTRAQFDELVLRFELDMREHMGLGSVLENRFNWTVIPGPTPQEKRLFDTACEKWDEYRRVVDGGACAVPHPATRLSRSLRVFVAWKPTVPHT